MAEGVFQKMVDDAGLGDRIEVDSAGTGAWQATCYLNRLTVVN